MDVLSVHRPFFFKDFREKEPLINLNEYIASGRQVADNTCTGYIVRHGNVVLLHYFFFYLRDNGLRVLGFDIDAHKYDVEHIIVELTDQQVTGVCYLPHGSKEFYWIRGITDLSKILIDGTRPVVYASRGKHASSPVPGTIWRYFGVANDHVRKPVPSTVTVVAASDEVMAEPRIDNVFDSLQDRVVGNFKQYSVVPLSKVRTHLLFKLPVGIRSYCKAKQKMILSIVVAISVIIVVAATLTGKKK